MPAWLNLALLGTLTAVALGCGDGSMASPPDASAGDAAAGDAALPPLTPEEAALSGVVINTAGEPITGLKILACDFDLCLTADTQPDGSYLFWAIEAGPRKMEVIDPMGAYAMIMFHQVAVAGEERTLERPVIAPSALDGLVPWPAEEGGSVVLLDGSMQLDADPGALRYAPGTATEEIGAISLSIETIPPAEREPWVGLEEQSFAFLFTPISLRSDPPVRLRFTPPGVLMPGTQYRMWTVDKVLAELVDAGTATVSTSGRIESDEGSSLDRIGMLFLVPEPTGG